MLGVFALRIITGFVMRPVLDLLSGSALSAASDFLRFALHYLTGILTAAVFVIAGAKPAPRRRFVTAIVLAGLWSCYALGSHVLVQTSRGVRNYADFVVEVVAAAGAAVVVGYSEESRRRR